MPDVYGFTSMISIVLSGSPVASNANRSVKSRRVVAGELEVGGAVVVGYGRSFGCDLVMIAQVGDAAAGRLAAQEVQQRGVALGGVGPGDGVRAAFDDDQLDVFDQGGQPLAGLFERQDLTVGMRDPFVNGDPSAPGRGPGAGRFRLQAGTETTVAFRAVHRTRTDPGRCPGLRVGPGARDYR